jgi:four helix bundle protein
MIYNSFEELDCWKAARDVKHLVKGMIRKLPDFERYDTIDNMRRASRSATRNIAEGFGRFSFSENSRFCIISRGSLYELIDDVITCFEEKYISEEEYKNARILLDRAITILNGYINYLDRQTANLQSKVSENEAQYISNAPPNSQ